MHTRWKLSRLFPGSLICNIKYQTCTRFISTLGLAHLPAFRLYSSRLYVFIKIEITELKLYHFCWRLQLLNWSNIRIWTSIACRLPKSRNTWLVYRLMRSQTGAARLQTWNITSNRMVGCKICDFVLCLILVVIKMKRVTSSGNKPLMILFIIIILVMLLHN